MYELVSVKFPFAENENKGKPRPSFVISPPIGKHKQIIVAYVTTRLDEILDTDIVLNPDKTYFSSTGLKQKSVIKLHRLITVQPKALKEGKGYLPKELIPEIKKNLMKIFQLK